MSCDTNNSKWFSRGTFQSATLQLCNCMVWLQISKGTLLKRFPPGFSCCWTLFGKFNVYKTLAVINPGGDTWCGCGWWILFLWFQVVIIFIIVLLGVLMFYMFFLFIDAKRRPVELSVTADEVSLRCFSWWSAVQSPLWGGEGKCFVC